MQLGDVLEDANSFLSALKNVPEKIQLAQGTRTPLKCKHVYQDLLPPLKDCKIY
jgi:hypothetical protein